jgi:tripartite ATP-independent transporter DctP family solute receptor
MRERRSIMSKTSHIAVFLLGLMLVGIVFVPASAVAKAEYEITLGYAVAAISPDAVLPEKFAELVSQKTDGRVEVKTFPGGQLGTLPSMFQGMKMGTLDMVMESPEWLSQVDKGFVAPGLLFLLANEKHAENLFNSAWFQWKYEILREKQGVRVLSWSGRRGPYKVFVTKKPVRSLEDFQGTKFRVPEIRTYRLAFQSVGAKPTVVAWKEVYMALQQGLVEGLESPLTLIYDMKFQDVAKNVIVTKHAYQYLVLMINEKKFQSLPEELQTTLIKCADEAGKIQAAEMYRVADEHIQKLKAAGVNFIEIDIGPFSEKVIPEYQKLEEEGAWEKGLVEFITSLKP